MLEDYIKLNDIGSVKELKDAVRQGIPSAVFGVNDAFKNYLAGIIDSQVLYVARDGVTAISAFNSLKETTDKKVVLIPAKDDNLTLNVAFSKDTVYSRITALKEIERADIIITTPEAILQKFTAKIQTVSFLKGENYSREHLLASLTGLGYLRVENIESKGTFAIRGDIVDIFAINHELPLRISFFDDQIESINFFDIETRKNAGFVESIEVCQAVENIFNDKELEDIFKALKEEVLNVKAENSARLKTIYDDLCLAREKKDFNGLFMLFCLSRNACSLTELIKKDAVIVFDEAKRIYELSELVYKEFSDRFNALFKAGEVFSFLINNLITLEDFKSEIKQFKLVTLQTLSTQNAFFNPLKIINPKVSGVANYRLDVKEVFVDVNNWLKTGYSVLIFTDDLKRAENLCIEFSDRGIASSINRKGVFTGVNILPLKLDNGFIFHEKKIAVIGSGNLYAKKVSERKIKRKKTAYFTAPETGDYAVHEVHGIGKVLGNKKITTTEGTKDYVAVEYAGGDILYVPVEQMDILTRYLGSEKHPRLSKIGGKDFERIKSAVKESIKKMSFDLKKLYEERSSLKGYKFTDDKELQEVFNASFPFEETPDQITATQEIYKDMTSGKVMDRLICGDVGFGKTEVAFRAAFLAIANGKQVALLAPTTILTEQHYNSAVERFKDFGVKIAVLNRFRSSGEQKKIVKAVKEGDIDLIIGTHRLLSKDIGFFDLGLLILDEEQRFGVEHKEKIKLLKKNIDTITLTATPIPRTLHMSLSGIREISTISTPPKSRLPVQTYVTEETEMLIKDATLREVNRGGQVFILYNRVESIFTFAESVKRILPDIKITVAHGRMDEKTLENNIMEFYNGKSDLLIATTIIENGIDLPRANTLIVIDADRLGLSTLYQLKGRVGRSDRLAYAYFTFKREKILSANAYERLNALMEFTEIGSGIKIAMRDLEIRGAGNVLGAEQHGHMDKIGYELYAKLLQEEMTGKEETTLDLDIRVSAFIPNDYIGSSSARMSMYKEIAEISSFEDEKDVITFMNEAYGKPPVEVENLINIAVVKRLAEKFGVSEINITKDKANLVFHNFKDLSNKQLSEKIADFNRGAFISVVGKPSLEFVKNGSSNEEMLIKIKEFFGKDNL